MTLRFSYPVRASVSALRSSDLAQLRKHFSQVRCGRIPLTDSDGPDQCLAKAEAITGRPFTNVLATDTSQLRNGFASPGWISDSDAQNLNLLDQPPSVTTRGAWVGGGAAAGDATPSASSVTHEIGHTLHWPHSFSGTTGSDYDNPTDVMSGSTAGGQCEKALPSGGITTWPCAPQNTLAFNRFAAGWIDDSQVQLQRSGSTIVTLDAPGAPGMQMIVAPDSADPHVMLTLEARPKVGYDQFFDTEGVAVYVIDQRKYACMDGAYYQRPCVSVDRRQRQAIDVAPSGYGHLLQIGTTTQINGLTITITAHVGNTFTVQINGTFVAPAPEYHAPL